MTSGWRIGSILGIPLLLNPAWFYSLILFSFVFSPLWQRAGWETGWAWLGGLMMSLLLFASVLLHELGHSLVARSQGISVNSITLFLFGGIASIEQESKTPGQAFWVAIAGPSVSFALSSLLFLLSLGLPKTMPIAIMLNQLAFINLVLALFNMIPGLPLDGGQVLKAAIWKLSGNRITGVRWAARVGQFLGWAAIFLGIAGVILLLRFSFLWLVLLGWFGIRRANGYLKMTKLQATMLQLQAGNAMRQDFRVVNANLTIQQFAATYLTDDPAVDLYYAETDGCYIGWVDTEALRSVERSLWETQPLSSILRPFEPSPTVRESTSLAEVIDQLETQQLQQLPVLSSEGMVTGVIDRADVAQALANYLNLLIPQPLLQQIKAEGQFPKELQLQGIAKDALK